MYISMFLEKLFFFYLEQLEVRIIYNYFSTDQSLRNFSSRSNTFVKSILRLIITRLEKENNSSFLSEYFLKLKTFILSAVKLSGWGSVGKEKLRGSEC